MKQISVSIKEHICTVVYHKYTNYIFKGDFSHVTYCKHQGYKKRQVIQGVAKNLLHLSNDSLDS